MTPTRRRFLSISAAALALPGVAMATPAARWRGRALGASASMVLSGVDATEARPVFAALEAELERLERIFSLYRADSALRRLNRDGRLLAPPAELLEVLSLGDALHRASGGAFDPTVQPLWQALAKGGDRLAAERLTGWHKVAFDTGAVQLAQPGMGLTLNGIAQGYVTDRISAMLRDRGYGDILVDIGEIAGFGQKPDGTAWQAGVATPQGQIVHRVSLRDRALATSAPGGTKLTSGQGHILAPAGHRVQNALAAVSAPTAALADGLSTAFCMMSQAQAEAAVTAFSGATIEILRG